MCVCVYSAGLTVRVTLFPDSIHSAVGLYPKEEAPVLTVQPLGVLVAPGGEAAAAAVVRCGGKRGDFSRGHLLVRPLLRLLVEAESRSPTEASHLPPSQQAVAWSPPPLHKLILLNLRGHFP